MCFGQSTTGTKTTTATPNPTVANAATQNLDTLTGLQNTGYQAYQGQEVANLTGLQNEGFGVAGNTPQSNPYSPTAAGYIQGVGSSVAPTVSSGTIASAMSPYMNAYVSDALAPQIQAQNQQFAGQNQQLDAAATSAGAYGDSRAGIEAANLTNQQDIARTGLVGQAYTNAFNTAIGAGAQDVSNNMQAQQATGQFQQGQENLGLNAGNAIAGLGTSNLGYAQNEANLLQQQGGIQQAQSQAELNVPYQNYLAAQQYPFLTSQALDQGISAGSSAMPATTTATTTAPNNAGYSLLGAIAPSLFNGGNQGFSGSAAGQATSGIGSALSSALGFAALSDERAKENIEKVGELDDGTPVKRFNYRADPNKSPQIGLVAQDVEKTKPEAVHEVGGIKFVDYAKATQNPKRKRPYIDMASLEGGVGMAA